MSPLLKHQQIYVSMQSNFENQRICTKTIRSRASSVCLACNIINKGRAACPYSTEDAGEGGRCYNRGTKETKCTIILMSCIISPLCTGLTRPRSNPRPKRVSELEITTCSPVEAQRADASSGRRSGCCSRLNGRSSWPRERDGSIHIMDYGR